MQEPASELDLPWQMAVDEYAGAVGLALAVIAVIIILRLGARGRFGAKGVRANLLLILGVGIALSSVLLMTPRFSGGGILDNILEGAEILDTGIQVRWPLLASVLLVCCGIFQRTTVASKLEEEEQ